MRENENLYSNLSVRAKAKIKGQLEETKLTLEELLQNKTGLLNEESALEALVTDFKSLLVIEDIKELIQKFFSLEILIQQLANEGIKLVDIDLFYQRLSPLLLRALWEQLTFGNGPSEIIDHWKSAVRIAIENLLYDLQART